MTALPSKDVLLANLDTVVKETLGYFEGPGRVTTPGSISGRPATC